MTKNEGFASLALIVIAVLILGGGYWVWQNKIGSLTSITTNPDDWQTYRNEEYGFEFRYPTKLKQQPSSTHDYGLPGERFDAEGLSLFIEVGKYVPEIYATSTNFNKVTINGYDAMVSENSNLPTFKSIDIVDPRSVDENQHNNKIGFFMDIYQKEKEGEFKNLFNQILSTFRFIK